MSHARHSGGCHCGAVRFDVELDLAAGGSRCNCTLCTKRNPLGAIVKPGAFRVRAGQASLTEYARPPVGGYFFCRRCGIHLFGRGDLPELGGEFVSVNLNCLDGVDPATLKVVHWDGRHDNWDAGPRDRPWPVHAEEPGADARI